MQTFLPFPDFKQSAAVLDDRRLFNQINECMSIARSLVTGKGWIYHPATLMWRGHVPALAQYAEACFEEEVVRHDQALMNEEPSPSRVAAISMAPLNTNGITGVREWVSPEADTANPPWLGDPLFHYVHQSNLRRKDPVYYRRFAEVPADLEYVWPHLDSSLKGGYRLRLSGAGFKRIKKGEARDPRQVAEIIEQLGLKKS